MATKYFATQTHLTGARGAIEERMKTSFVFQVLVSATGLLVSSVGSLSAGPTVEMKKVLDAYSLLSPLPLDKATPTVARLAPSMSAAAKAVMLKEGKRTPDFTGKIEDIKIPTSTGELDARVYTPGGEGPFPTILFIHGGGWVIADVNVYDSSARALCEMTKALVISTDYRKAPEHKFPSSHDDTWAAYQWVLQNTGNYHGDPKKVAVAGESAGGNMAGAICYQARDQGVQIPVHQLLIYPVTDTNMETASYKENQETKPLNAKGMKWFFGYELGKATDGDDPRFSILRSPNMKGLPPATIIAAEIDPLRSEGEAYAEKLKAAGVTVTYKRFKGVTHEFFGMGAVVPEAQEAETLAATQLKKAFGSN